MLYKRNSSQHLIIYILQPPFKWICYFQKMMCNIIARTNWSNTKSNYFVHTIIIFNLSHYTNITITVTFVNHLTLCGAFFLFLPKYYPYKSCTIFHINLYMFNIHTEISKGTNKLNHVKPSAVFQNEPFWILYGKMNHLCHDWNKRMLTIVQNTFYNRRAWWLSLVNEWFVIDELVAVSIVFWHGVTNDAVKPDFIFPTGDNGSLYEGHFSGKLIVILINETLLSMKQQLHQKNANTRNQWNTALKEAAIVSKIRTPAITLWFPEHRFTENFYLGFFIKEKRLASQVVFLVKSKHWVLAKIQVFGCLRYLSRTFVREFFF
jgi:hypothetical protein